MRIEIPTLPFCLFFSAFLGVWLHFLFFYVLPSASFHLLYFYALPFAGAVRHPFLAVSRNMHHLFFSRKSGQQYRMYDHSSLTRVTKSYLLALGTTQISSFFTKL